MTEVRGENSPERQLVTPEVVREAHRAFMLLVDGLGDSKEGDRQVFKDALKKAVEEGGFPLVFNRYLCDAVYLEMENFFRELQRLRRDMGGLARSGIVQNPDARVDAMLEVKTHEFLGTMIPYLEALEDLKSGKSMSPALKMLAVVLRPSINLVPEDDVTRAQASIVELDLMRELVRNVRDNDGGGRNAAYVLARVLEKADDSGGTNPTRPLASGLTLLLARSEGIPSSGRPELGLLLESMGVDDLRARLNAAGLLPSSPKSTELPEHGQLRQRLLVTGEVGEDDREKD